MDNPLNLISIEELESVLVSINMNMSDEEKSVFLYFYGTNLFPLFISLEDNIKRFRESFVGIYFSMFEYIGESTKELPKGFIDEKTLLKMVCDNYVFWSYGETSVMFSNKIKLQ